MNAERLKVYENTPAAVDKFARDFYDAPAWTKASTAAEIDRMVTMLAEMPANHPERESYEEWLDFVKEQCTLDPRQPLLQCKAKSYMITPRTRCGLARDVVSIWTVYERFVRLDDTQGQEPIASHPTLADAEKHTQELYTALGFGPMDAQQRANTAGDAALKALETSRPTKTPAYDHLPHSFKIYFEDAKWIAACNGEERHFGTCSDAEDHLRDYLIDAGIPHAAQIADGEAARAWDCFVNA